MRIERLLAASASIKGTARKFDLPYHALRRHWNNHVSAEARATYIAGAGIVKDQLEEVIADESLALIDHYRIVRGALYKGLSAASEVGDNNALGLLAARLHENFRDCGRLTGELQRGPLLNVQTNVLVNPDLNVARDRLYHELDLIHERLSRGAAGRLIEGRTGGDPEPASTGTNISAAERLASLLGAKKPDSA